MAQAQRKETPARDWPFEVKPLHPALGVEITGITLAQAVEPGLFDKVYEAFLDHELILFRDVDLPRAQVRLCARFRRLVAAGKNVNMVTTAVAREMAAFAWAIACQVQPKEAAA